MALTILHSPNRGWFPPLPDAAIKPLNSSARNLLIGKVASDDLCGFRAFPESDTGEKNGPERVEKVRNGVVGTLYRSARLRRNPRAYAELRKKIPTGEGWDFGYWWWDGIPHQTTIESTQSKRCGLLRTIANSIEKPAGL